MKKLIILLLIIFFIAGCQSKAITGVTVKVAGGSYQNIVANELNTIWKNKDFVFVNVHIPFAGKIADIDLSLPYDQISSSENLSQLPTDKSAKIVLYCRSGRMSAIVAEELISLGYTNIWNLDGGMDAWEKASYPLEK